MAVAVDFNGANLTLAAPKGQEDRVYALKAFTNGNVIATCWELSPEDLAEANRTGKIFVSQVSGPNFFPMFVGHAESVRALAIDYGRTFPKQED